MTARGHSWRKDLGGRAAKPANFALPADAGSAEPRIAMLASWLAMPRTLRDPSLAILRCDSNSLTQDDIFAFRVQGASRSFLTSCRVVN